MTGVSDAAVRRHRLVSRLIFSASVVGSALALGAIHAEVLCAVAFAAALAMALLWATGRKLAAPPRSAATLLVGVAVLLIGATVVQLAPLPASFLNRIAPANADVWMHATSPLRSPAPAYAPLTLDPVSTRVEVLRGLTYLAIFLATLRLAHRQSGADFCATLLVGTAVLLGVTALLHPAFGMTKVFGVYQPTTPIPERHVGPILNANALAAYLNIGFCISLARSLSPRSAPPRVLMVASAILLGAIQVWVASRGGVLAMLFGGVLVTWFSLRGWRTAHRRPAVTAVASGVAIAIAVMIGVLAAADDAWGELADRDLSKLRLFSQVTRMVRAFPWFGAGRGAFESVFPAYREGVHHYVFTHPENLLLQWSSEWGIPITLVGLAGIGWALRPSVVLARSHVVVGAWGGLASAFVHNMVDLNSEFPGILIALSVCAGMTVAGSSGTTPRSFLALWPRWPRAMAGGIVVAVVVGAAVVLIDRNRDLYTDRSELHRLAVAEAADKEQFRERAHGAILRHPAEPYLPFTGAVRAFRNGDPDITLWASRVLDRAPVYGPMHLLLARSFVKSSPAQARLEYRLAMSQAPELLLSYLPETVRLVGTYEHAMELVPHDATGLEVLHLLAAELKARLPATQARLGEELLLRTPNAAEPLLLRVEAAVADLLEPDVAPWCQADRDGCVQNALEQAKQYQAIQPERCDGYRLYAEARIASGGDDAVLDDFKRSAESVLDRSNCLKAVVSLVCKVGSEAKIRAAIDQIVRAGCTGADECVANIHFAARIERERGNTSRALSFYRRAYERYPDRDDSLVEAAELAKKVGLSVEAMRLYSILARRHPEDARWSEALRDARTRALQSQPHHP